jgi:hypothetical protein
MDRPVKKEWLEPFREHAELEAQEKVGKGVSPNYSTFPSTS